MAKEIEVKVLNIDLDEMEKKLEKLGAKLIAKEYQKNIIFDSKDRYIEKELNSYLRIRETKNLLSNEINTKLTLKKNINKEGTRKNIEITTQIEDVESMIIILKALKYEIMEEGYKERKSFKYNNIRFDLDKWDKDTYPFPYMEIEVEKEDDLEIAIKLLNIDRNHISTKSIMELKEDL
ncbi:class IV adenylate cyclase [Clostridium sp. Cult2]|uniref:class IV adenylate cyclase n=1 Tax=Clostridium sp. Cult2 TaxID=2079003 RepID=UPI001F3EBCA4|nr:class IV adenylate cyclase [Clostridium sp. Cult2]MCF6465815.1 adenylate cyclase [Clostridium sp. Cult2]